MQEEFVDKKSPPYAMSPISSTIYNYKGSENVNSGVPLSYFENVEKAMN